MSYHRPYKVLLVEDNPALARLYLDYLRQEPCQVRHVANGQEAMDQVTTGQFDAFILDIQLPDISGLNILRRISYLPIPNSVIMMTAHGTIDTAVESLIYGAIHYLNKPFEAAQLIQMLRQLPGYPIPEDTALSSGSLC